MSLFVPEGTRASAMLRGSGVRGSRLVRCMIEPCRAGVGTDPSLPRDAARSCQPRFRSVSTVALSRRPGAGSAG